MNSERRKHRILLVEDDDLIQMIVRDFLEGNGYDVEIVRSTATALEAIDRTLPDVALLDYSLPDGNSLDLLVRIKQLDAGVGCIVLTAHASIDLAVRAIKLGAEQFLTKPVELTALLAMIDRVVADQRGRRAQVAQQAARRTAPDPFIGGSAAITAVRAACERVLATTSPILIRGETGTGKSLLARWLHDHGPRRDEAFVDLNCASLSQQLLESELFGHEKGAFTGATATKQGLLEIANHGTVFLDEIGDMEPQVQPKLLKVVDERRLRRVGGLSDRHVDVQLIAATHQPLEHLVRERRFREDLYFRISSFPITLPSLRDRRDDIPAIARHFVEGLSRTDRKPMDITPAAMAALQDHGWPGNIRELRSVIERAALLSSGASIDVEHLTLGVAVKPSSDGTDQMTLAELERHHIDRVLAAEGGRVEVAAARLGISRSSLYQRLAKLKQK